MSINLPTPTVARTSVPVSQRVDPAAGPERNPHKRVTVTGRVGQGRRATVLGVRWGALGDDSPGILMSKCRTAAAAELKVRDKTDPTVLDVADEVMIRALKRAHAETDGATCAPREDTVRMAYLRLEARDVIRAARKVANAENGARSEGADMDAEIAAQRAHAERVRLLSIDDATRAANDAARLTETALRGDVWTLVYDALRGAEGATVAAELGITLDALKGRLKRARALLSTTYPTPAALISALLLMDDADAGSDRSRARLEWRPRDTHDAETWETADADTCARIGNVQTVLPLRWTWEQIRATHNARLASYLPAPRAHTDAETVNPAQMALI